MQKTKINIPIKLALFFNVLLIDQQTIQQLDLASQFVCIL